VRYHYEQRLDGHVVYGTLVWLERPVCGQFVALVVVVVVVAAAAAVAVVVY